MLMPNRLLSHPPLCHNFQSHKYLNRARKANVFFCFVFFFFVSFAFSFLLYIRRYIQIKSLPKYLTFSIHSFRIFVYTSTLCKHTHVLWYLSIFILFLFVAEMRVLFFSSFWCANCARCGFFWSEHIFSINTLRCYNPCVNRALGKIELCVCFFFIPIHKEILEWHFFWTFEGIFCVCLKNKCL